MLWMVDQYLHNYYPAPQSINNLPSYQKEKTPLKKPDLIYFTNKDLLLLK